MPIATSTRPTRRGDLIVLLATIAYLGVVCTFGFTNAEDQGLITENPNLNPPTPAGLWEHWRRPHLFLYVPVTYTAWWLLALIGQTSTPDETGATLNPWLFHTFNLALHVTTALLVLNLLRRLIGKEGPAVVGALLFALHPIQVEAVAWTTGTKDVLCGMFSFAALLLYVKSAEKPLPHAGAERSAAPDVSSQRRRRWYAIASVILLLALLSKPAAAVIPLMTLILDRMLLARPWRTVLRSSIPWFAVAIPFLVIARLVQPAADVTSAPMWARPLIAADALAFYLWKIICPFDLTIDYARPPKFIIESGAIAWTWTLPAALAIALLLFARRSRVLVAAGLLFVAGLLPVLGLTTFLYQRYSTVADRFVYLSMFAVALAIAWGLSCCWSRKVAIACGVLLVLLGARSTVQALTWRNRMTLYIHAVAISPHSAAAHNNYGNALLKTGDVDAADREFRKALELDPEQSAARYNLDLIRRARGVPATTTAAPSPP
ncbi:MAG: tetratricopeptide repeat protein [Tepidisphaeraceae bacterium]